MSRLWNLLRASKDIRRSQKMSREDLLLLQEQRWRRLARLAREKSPFYRNQFKGLDLERCAFEELPVLTKAMLVEHWDEIVTDPRLRQAELTKHFATPGNWNKLLHGRWMVSMTSGTTGAAIITAHDIAVVDWNHAAHAIRNAPLPAATSNPRLPIFRRRQVAAAFVSLSAPSISSALVSTRPWLGNVFFDYRPINVTSPWEEITVQVEHMQPDILIGYASMIGRLAKAKLEGKLRLELPSDGVISTGGDCLTPGIRELCRQAFGLDPLDGYGCGETLGIARQWQGMSRPLIFEDLFVYEAVDSDERPCAEGELSDHALVTPLLNNDMPLLRYRLNDRVCLGPVQEGWPFRTIERLSGRSSLTFVFKIPHEQVFVGSKLMVVLQNVPQVVSYQFRQTSASSLECLFIPAPASDIAGTESLLTNRGRKCLDGADCATVTFVAKAVPHLEPDARTGKVEQYVPLAC